VIIVLIDAVLVLECHPSDVKPFENFLKEVYFKLET
jgi:hypothetical protein